MALFINNNLTASTVVMTYEARTGWSATWKCALRMRTAGKSKTLSSITVVRNSLARTT